MIDKDIVMIDMVMQKDKDMVMIDMIVLVIPLDRYWIVSAVGYNKSIALFLCENSVSWCIGLGTSSRDTYCFSYALARIYD